MQDEGKHLGFVPADQPGRDAALGRSHDDDIPPRHDLRAGMDIPQDEEISVRFDALPGTDGLGYGHGRFQVGRRGRRSVFLIGQLHSVFIEKCPEGREIVGEKTPTLIQEDTGPAEELARLVQLEAEFGQEFPEFHLRWDDETQSLAAALEGHTG